MDNYIHLRGVRENNLKNINLDIPRVSFSFIYWAYNVLNSSSVLAVNNFGSV